MDKEKIKNSIKSNLKHLYVFGVRNGGTTVLASILGAHKDINMLNQPTEMNENRLIGKKYQGAKYLVFNSIRWSYKSTRIRNLFINKLGKIITLFKEPYLLKPQLRYNIKDLIKKECKIILIYREPQENIKSLIRNSGFTLEEAEYAYYEAMKVMTLIATNSDHLKISLAELTKHKIKSLRKICEYIDIPYDSQMLNGAKYQYTYPHTKILRKK